jgi:hypothetical protein
MANPHISMKNDLDVKVRKYCDENDLKYSQGVRRLIEIGLENIDVTKKIDSYNSMLEKIFSRQIYIRDLIEQLYTDLEIDTSLNPKDNKSLQNFKNNKYKDMFNE